MMKMKTNNKVKGKIAAKLAGVVAVISAFAIGFTPMIAFAQVPVCTCETKCTEDEINPDCEICKEDITMCEGTEPEKEPEEVYGPLTPDGNMTMVDDYGTIEAGGKQFITVVTKTGNYFYIIIDRDDEGNETVHFLNMVDESDLLKLMDDEEAQAYVESIAGTTEETTEVVEEPKEPETETATEEEKPEPEKKNNTTGIMALILLAAVGGIGGFLFLKNSKKKKPVNSGPDPDFDYNEDEDDYLAGLEEDEDEVDIMDEDDFEEEEPDPEKPGE